MLNSCLNDVDIQKNNISKRVLENIINCFQKSLKRVFKKHSGNLNPVYTLELILQFLVIVLAIVMDKYSDYSPLF